MENKQYFDPYNFNNTNISNSPSPAQIPDEINFMPAVQPNPIMFYEQQYWYYKYLTKMLEYKIKLKEYENINNCKNQ